MRKIFLLFALASNFLINAQTAPAIEWEKSIGGSKYDYARSIQQTIDGGYIVAGYSQSNDGDVTGHHGNENYPDYWIVKLGNGGNIQWQKSLGGSNSDEAHSIQQTSDGGYIVAGLSLSTDGDVIGNHGNTDFWIVKMDNSGNLQWQKSMGGTNNEAAYSVQQTKDGGYIVAGYSNSTDGDATSNHATTGSTDYWVVKLDQIGNIQWQKSLGGNSFEYAYSIRQTVDDGYIISGYSASNNGDVTENHGGPDYWIVKLNSSGNIQWQKSLGGHYIDAAYSMELTKDGGYIIAGKSNSINGDVTGNHGDLSLADYWIVKLNNNGSIQWQKSLGGSGDDIPYSIQQTLDGGYVVAGSSNSNDDDVTGNHGNIDCWIVKLDSVGNIQWQKSLGGSGADAAYSIQQTTDGGFMVAGFTTSNDGDVSGNQDGYNYWIVKLSATGLSVKDQINVKSQIYPNPVKDILTFSEEFSNVKVTDVSGKVVKQFLGPVKSLKLLELVKGTYIITADTKSGNKVSEKLIKD